VDEYEEDYDHDRFTSTTLPHSDFGDGECCGCLYSAKQFTGDLAFGKTVTLQVHDLDRHGRFGGWIRQHHTSGCAKVEMAY
jgi:hypothetical protein